jgi:hypothetical protein
MDPHLKAKESEMTTKHNHQLVFGRKEAGCPRCEELKAGVAPVRWSGVDRKKEQEQLMAAIRAHDCVKSRCGVVCTAFQW